MVNFSITNATARESSSHFPELTDPHMIGRMDPRTALYHRVSTVDRGPRS